MTQAPERLVWGSDWPHVTEKHKPDDAATIPAGPSNFSGSGAQPLLGADRSLARSKPIPPSVSAWTRLRGAARRGVIRFQHCREISSVLIRNTVGPSANRTTPGSYLVIGASNHRKSEFVMSRIPLDFQRRCERRWAVRFSQPVGPIASRKRRPEREGQQIAGPDKSKTKTRAGSKRPT